MIERHSWLARRRILLGALLADAGRSLATRRFQATASAVALASGITAVALLVSVVSGLHRFTVATFASAGGNVIVATAQADDERLRDTRSLPATLRAGDEAAVLASSPAFDLASAENLSTQPVTTADRRSDATDVRGITADGFEILQLHVTGGRLFVPEEQAQGTRVAVIGAHLARALFGAESPLGQTVVVGDWPFTVVGELDWVGDPETDLRSGLDETLFVPFRAAADALHGDDQASALRFRLRTTDTEASAVAEVYAALDRQRRLRGETGGELRVTNTIQRLRVLRRVIVGLRILAVVVGLVGLVAGAMGIANVLLMSVRERTVEIGIRRAFGATRDAVFAGFLFEALAIALAGGGVGLVVAFAITRMAAAVPQLPPSARPEISGTTSVVAVLLLVLVGLIAGIAPARRAASVYPAEALRTAD
ncbi:MAG: ABC transporter permease [Vicinamibacterales bacterium]